ncbi:MAG: S-methyl-5-thioribose-1-phosphate isomerase [Gammaproteobacteria bacterium]
MITEYLKEVDRSALHPVSWADAGVVLLDQRQLPERECYLHLSTAESVAEAIGDMVVRGAPAIGLAAAYGAVLAARSITSVASPDHWLRQFSTALQSLADSRPTAVNLAWALAKMEHQAAQLLAAGEERVADHLRCFADQLLADDLAQGEQMARLGADWIEPGSNLLTHCNAGGLATGGVGTALGVVNRAWRQGNIKQVYVSETRPWLQGSRLTAWELQRQGMRPCLLVEGAVAALLREKSVQWLIVGADRIAANGDVANKIGTYGAALLARQHGVRVMVVAPTSTIDLACGSGAEIEIEQRDREEVTRVGSVNIAPEQTAVWNPVFDITPAANIDLLVTEKGILERPCEAEIRSLFG